MTTSQRRVMLMAGSLAAAFACRPPGDRRAPPDFDRMRQQRRYDAYETSQFFPDGAAMRTPPAHTVSRTMTPNDPISLDSARAIGGRQFAISCVPCHGTGGAGGGLIAANLVEKPPGSLRTAAVKAMSSTALFALITDGEGAMPALGWQMPPARRWAVIAYLQSQVGAP